MLRSGLLISISAVIVLRFAWCALHAASFSGLGVLQYANRSYANSLSADGSVVVGTSWQAAYWTSDEGLTAIEGFELEVPSTALAVSGDGTILVGMYGPHQNDGFRWSPATGPVPLAPPGSDFFNNIPTAVSHNGSFIVGFSMASPEDRSAFVWTSNAGITSLVGLEPSAAAQALDISGDGSIIVGASYKADVDAMVAIRWHAGVPMQLAAGLSSAHAVSADGNTIVGSMLLTDGSQAFRWTAPFGAVPLGDLPGGSIYSLARDVSGDGSVVVGDSAVGFGSDTTSGREAFIWTESQGMRHLATVLREDFSLTESLFGWTLNEATAISLDGSVIVGNGINPLGQREAWRTILKPVPEPATLLSAFVGLAALVIFAAKRHSS